MKKLILLSLIALMASCTTTRQSTYTLPKNPETPLILENLSKIKDFQNLVGVGVSFSDSFTLIEGNAENNREEVSENGILNIFDIFSGYKLNIPKEFPIIFNGGPLKGQKVISHGNYLYQEMVGVISDVVVDQNGLPIEIKVLVMSDNRKDELVFSIKEYKEAKKFYLKKQKKSESFSGKMIESFGLGCDQYENIVSKNGNIFYYLLETDNESLWFVSHADRSVYLDKFFLNYQKINDVKNQQAVPAIVGSKLKLERK